MVYKYEKKFTKEEHSGLMYTYEFERDKSNNFIISIDDRLSPNKHFHNCMEIIYIIDGEATAHIDGEMYELSSGQMCVVSCFSTHYYEQKRAGQYGVCLIPIRFFRESASIFNSKSFIHPIINDIGSKPLLHVFHMALNLSCDRDIFGVEQKKYTEKYIETQLYYLSSYVINFCIDQCGLHERHRISSLAADAVRLIESDFKKNLTVSSISRALGCYQKNLSYHFRKTMNMSLTNYIDRTRVIEAARLLRSNPQMTIEAVMLESGFKSSRSFLRHFKNVFNCTPTEYRSEQKKF